MKLAGTIAVTEIWAKIKAYITTKLASYATKTELSNHTTNVSNPHGVSYIQLNGKITCMNNGTTWRKIILSFTIPALELWSARFDFTYYAKNNNSWTSRGDILLSILFTSSAEWVSNLSVTNWYGDIPNFYLIDNGSGSFQFAISNDNLNSWSEFDIYLKHIGGNVNTYSYGDQGSTTSGSVMSKSIGKAYTVGTLTITENGTSVGTFNGSANTTIALTDTTYSDVTTTTHGLMTATDKVKLNSISQDASGNTLFPGIVTASAFSGNASSATKAVQDGSGNVITSTYLPLAGGTLTGDLIFSDSGTATKGIYGTVGFSDAWRLIGGASAENSGWLELATADDGTEPIYVRQYTYDNGPYPYCYFSKLVRTATLLDASGNTSFPGTVTASAFSGNATSATKAVQDGNGNVIADRYLTRTRIETSYETNMTGKVVAFGRYYSTGSKSDVHTTFETFITAAGLAWVLSDTPVAYSNRLKSSAWDWEGSGPTGTGSRVLHIATISGLGLIHIKGIHSAGTSGSMGIIDVEIGPRTGSLNHAEKAISDSSLAYVSGSSIDTMELYVKEAYGANHYQMSVVEMIAGAAIIWDTTSSAVTAPTNLVSIT